MRNVRKIARNLLSLYSGEAVSSALAFVITILLARRLSDEGFGRLALVQSVIAYPTLIVDMGLGTYGAREIARFPDRYEELAANIVSLRVFLSLIVGIIFSAGVVVYPMTEEMRWLYWASALGLFTYALNPEFGFQGMERMNGIAAWRILVHVFYLVLIFVLIAGREHLWSVPILRILAESLTLIIISSWLIYIHGQRLHFAWQPQSWLRYLRESTVIIASVVMNRIFYSFDVIMLGMNGHPEEIGWYQAAYKIVLMCIGVAALTLVAFAPLFSKNWKNNDQLDRITSEFGILLFAFSSFICGLIIIYHQVIINLLYGTSFYQAGPALHLLAWGMFFVFLHTTFMAPLLYINQQKKYFTVATIGVAINIILNLYLIPRYGFIGAAAAMLASNIFLFIIAISVYVIVVKQNASIKHMILWVIIFLLCFGLRALLIPGEFIWGIFLLMIYETAFAFFHRAKIRQVFSSWSISNR